METSSIPRMTSSAGLRIARIVHAFALLPLLFMLLSLPIPPSGAEVRPFVVLLACVAGSVAVIYGITRRRAFAPWLAVALGMFGLVSLAAALLRGGSAGFIVVALPGSVWISYITGMLCCVGALRARPAEIRG